VGAGRRPSTATRRARLRGFRLSCGQARARSSGDRASVSGTEGRRFDSCRARQYPVWAGLADGRGGRRDERRSVPGMGRTRRVAASPRGRTPRPRTNVGQYLVWAGLADVRPGPAGRTSVSTRYRPDSLTLAAGRATNVGQYRVWAGLADVGRGRRDERRSVPRYGPDPPTFAAARGAGLPATGRTSVNARYGPDSPTLAAGAGTNVGQYPVWAGLADVRRRPWDATSVSARYGPHSPMFAATSRARTPQRFALRSTTQSHGPSDPISSPPRNTCSKAEHKEGAA
jgi:hypothetical protein